MKHLIILALLAAPAVQAYDFNKTIKQNAADTYGSRYTEHKPRTNSWGASDSNSKYNLPFAPAPQRLKTNCSYVFGQLRCN